MPTVSLRPISAIDLPIAEGDLERDSVRQQTPQNFAFHFPGSATPGDASNSYIYAHARRGMFLTLWSAREVVRSGSWAARSTTERLTLQTSTGPNPGDPRFVVIAPRV